MTKIPVGQGERPPMFEMVILPADSRPVVIRLPNEFISRGDIEISDGPVEDMVLAAWVLNLVINAVADEQVEREGVRIQDLFGRREAKPVDTGKPPF